MPSSSLYPPYLSVPSHSPMFIPTCSTLFLSSLHFPLHQYFVFSILVSSRNTTKPRPQLLHLPFTKNSPHGRRWYDRLRMSRSLSRRYRRRETRLHTDRRRQETIEGSSTENQSCGRVNTTEKYLMGYS
jgi:hypothetical protein